MGYCLSALKSGQETQIIWTTTRAFETLSGVGCGEEYLITLASLQSGMPQKVGTERDSLKKIC
jgi:hypothetical protein